MIGLPKMQRHSHAELASTEIGGSSRVQILDGCHEIICAEQIEANDIQNCQVDNCAYTCAARSKGIRDVIEHCIAATAFTTAYSIRDGRTKVKQSILATKRKLSDRTK